MLSPQEVGELINFSTSFSLPINPIDKKYWIPRRAGRGSEDIIFLISKQDE